MSNAVRMGGTYPLAEGENPPRGMSRKSTRARWTGEKRYAKRGEWFLSGAIVEAYRGPSVYPMHIAELVESTGDES